MQTSHKELHAHIRKLERELQRERAQRHVPEEVATLRREVRELQALLHTSPLKLKAYKEDRQQRMENDRRVLRLRRRRI